MPHVVVTFQYTNSPFCFTGTMLSRLNTLVQPHLPFAVSPYGSFVAYGPNGSSVWAPAFAIRHVARSAATPILTILSGHDSVSSTLNKHRDAPHPAFRVFRVFRGSKSGSASLHRNLR